MTSNAMGGEELEMILSHAENDDAFSYIICLWTSLNARPRLEFIFTVLHVIVSFHAGLSFTCTRNVV